MTASSFDSHVYSAASCVISSVILGKAYNVTITGLGRVRKCACVQWLRLYRKVLNVALSHDEGRRNEQPASVGISRTNNITSLSLFTNASGNAPPLVALAPQ